MQGSQVEKHRGEPYMSGNYLKVEAFCQEPLGWLFHEAFVPHLTFYHDLKMLPRTKGRAVHNGNAKTKVILGFNSRLG